MNDSENRHSFGDAAKNAAGNFKQGAEQAIDEIKSRGAMGIFSFEHLYFPAIARCLFIILFILVGLGVILGVIAGLATMVNVGVIYGFITMISVILSGVLGLIGLRVWFEMLIVAFKINESLEKIRGNCCK
ncbi:MAG: DUF4282 domain-containing protein [Planctomycetes bacterium]|nr:DUF4282 domain-containing protein [Planctomycetota bacterium]